MYVLGGGDFGKLIPIVFLGVMTVFSLTRLFGASWLRLRSGGLLLLLVIVAILMAIIPSAASIMASVELWWLAVLAIAVITLASSGTWALLRSATVR